MNPRDMLAEGAIRKILVSQIRRDERVNRALRPGHVKGMTNNFNIKAIGVLTVSQRDTDEFIVLDGQHRHQAMVDLGMGDKFVWCRVFKGLTLPQEAAIFRALNNTKKPRQIDDFLKGLIAEDADCIAISDIVGEYGWTVSEQLSTHGAIPSVAALRSVYGSGDKTHPDVLRATIGTITDAWGHRSEAINGQIITGLGMLFATYNGGVERDVLTKKLSKFPGGPGALLGQAKGLRAVRGGTVPRALAASLVDLYNRGRRSNKLPLDDR